MKRLCTLILALAWCATAHAATTYVSQSGGTFSGGTACNGQTAISLATFNGSTPSPGDHIYWCGILTSEPIIGGSGTSGNPITITFDTGARISIPVFTTIGFNFGSHNYIVVDGGTPCGPGTTCYAAESANPTGYPSGITGIVEATASGTALAHQPGPCQAIWLAGSNVEIKNLIIRNVYQHTPGDGHGGAGDYSGIYIGGAESNLLVHDSDIHDVSAGIQGGSGPAVGNTFYNNALWNINWGISQGTTTGQTQSNLTIRNNVFGSTANWDGLACPGTNCNSYHHDQVFLYDNCSGCGNFNGVYIYNNTFSGALGADATGRLYFGGGQEQNAYIFNNIFNNSGQTTGPTNTELEATGEATQTAFIINNSIIGAGTSIDVGPCMQDQGAVWMYGNAIEGCGSMDYMQNGTYGGGPATISNLDYNGYGASSSTATWQWDGHTSQTTLPGWQSLTGAEAHSTYTLAGLNLNSSGVPQAGSPLIGAEASLSALCIGPLVPLCSDFNNNPRTGPYWDAGAFNFSSSSATTYYVSNSGSDSNNGTSTGTPWKTVAHVNSQSFNPGDSVLFLANGTWRERLVFPSSGSAGNQITLGAYGSGAMPIITGGSILSSGWTNTSGNVWQVALTTQTYKVRFNGTVGTLEGSVGAITAPNEWYWASNVLYVYSTSNPATAYTSPGIEAAVLNDCIEVSQNYVTVSGLHTTMSNNQTNGGIVTNGSNLTVSGNLSDYNVSAGIRVWNNTTQDILISSNETAFNGQGIYSYQHSAALGHEVIVQYNNIHDNTSVGGVGDTLMINANYWIVQYNWLHNNGDTVGDDIGIHIYSTGSGAGWGQHNIVRYNLVSGQTSSTLDGSCIELDKYTQNNQIYNNVLTGCAGPGIDVYDSSNVSIYGNTLYNNWQNPISGTPDTELSLAGPIGLTTGALVENNIAYSTGSAEYAVYMDSQTTSHPPTFKTNLWYAPNSSNWYYNGAAGNSLSTWNALSYAGTDKYGNPLFTSAPSNLSLQSGSPAIGVGTTLASPYNVGIVPGSTWPGSVTTGTQTSPPTLGAYLLSVASVGFSPTSLSFSNQMVGTSSSGQAITLTNTGSATLTISSITITGTNAVDFSNTTTCGSTLGAGSNCTITVTFSPLVTGGLSAAVSVADNASGSPQTVSLTGTGTAPTAGVSPSTLTFSSQIVGTTSSSQAVTLSNTGTATLTIASIVVTGDFAQTGTCGSSLAASSTCTMNVTFTPTTIGTRSGTLTVTDNSGGTSGSTQTVSLSGTGIPVAEPIAGVSPSTLTFSSQTAGTTSASQAVTLSNTGTATLTISSIVATSNFGQSGTCGSTLAASTSCTINVTFSPMTIGTLTGTLTVTDNSGGTPGSTQTVNLSGTGVPASPVVGAPWIF